MNICDVVKFFLLETIKDAVPDIWSLEMKNDVSRHDISLFLDNLKTLWKDIINCS